MLCWLETRLSGRPTYFVKYLFILWTLTRSDYLHFSFCLATAVRRNLSLWYGGVSSLAGITTTREPDLVIDYLRFWFVIPLQQTLSCPTTSYANRHKSTCRWCWKVKLMCTVEELSTSKNLIVVWCHHALSALFYMCAILAEKNPSQFRKNQPNPQKTHKN